MLKHQLMKTGLEIETDNKLKVRILFLDKGITRVSCANSGDDYLLPAMNKYGFIRESAGGSGFKVEEDDNVLKGIAADIIVEIVKNPFSINFLDSNGNLLTGTSPGNGFQLSKSGGYKVNMNLGADERFFGFGDQNREKMEHRGSKAIMWIRNVVNYIPIPFFLSTNGYAFLVNTTWKHYFDMGASDNQKYYWKAMGGMPDFYFIPGPDFSSLLDRYTDLTGKPPLPPLWSFGLWFLCRMYADDREVVDNALQFRDRQIPCDVIGLEPGWMKAFYDLSTKKEWHPERFRIPPWSLKGGRTFISALKRLGFKFGLWEGNNYDLSYEAERKIKLSGLNNPAIPDTAFNAPEQDEAEFPLMPHAPAFRYEHKLDQLTIPEEPWFEHHKKFIEMGVDFFKQDGCEQTHEHPDRLYANGMSDMEMHNLYPLLYVQQMHEGFKEYTKKRPVCFTPNGWAGLQRYTGTWAGDTGGGPKSLIASLNLAFCAQTYTTCDMNVFTPEGIHFGFLQPWSQVNSFGTWSHPWLLGEKLGAIFKFYAQLRYQLIPYIYSYAYQSLKTGMPIIRPMPLAFPQDKNTFGLLNQYMLGHELLVGAFTDKIYLPDGKWLDYWSGKQYTGGTTVACNIPTDRGGALFVRAGAVIPMVERMECVGRRPWVNMMLDVYPGADSCFLLYEDDGVSLEYENGRFATTEIKTRQQNDTLHVDIRPRTGGFADMPTARNYLLKIHVSAPPENIRLNQSALAGPSAAVGFKDQGWCFDEENKMLWIALRENKTTKNEIRIAL